MSQLIRPTVLRFYIIWMLIYHLPYVQPAVFIPFVLKTPTLPGALHGSQRQEIAPASLVQIKYILFNSFKLFSRGIRWLNIPENILPKSVWMESFAVKIQCYSEPLCAPLIEKLWRWHWRKIAFGATSRQLSIASYIVNDSETVFRWDQKQPTNEKVERTWELKRAEKRDVRKPKKRQKWVWKKGWG